MSETKRTIVDANVGVMIVLNYPLSDAATERWQHWLEEGTEIFAPGLWLNEVTSSIHKVFRLGAIDKEEANAALEAVLRLELEWMPETPELSRAAFLWASRLLQVAAYDGFYLALAEQLGAPLWTGDKRLMNRAHQVGAQWVHWIGEDPE